MTRHRFRLERVLHARRAAEQMQRAELARAETRARRAEDAERTCGESVAAASEDVRAAQSSETLDAQWITIAHGAHERMCIALRSLHEIAGGARRAASIERSAWRALRADVRGLERLEARGRERAREKVAADEERAIEEFAARRAEERRTNGGRR
jgi:hypothetical protein